MRVKGFDDYKISNVIALQNNDDEDDDAEDEAENDHDEDDDDHEVSLLKAKI